jgi:hypothetical protein
MSGAQTLPAPTPVLQQVRTAVLANMRPGLVLWCLLLLLLLAYATVPTVHTVLADWGAVKQAWGYPFSFVSYVFFAALVPEVLSRWILQQKPSATPWADLFYAGLVFGMVGVWVDILYTLQVQMFGGGTDWITMVKKMLVDQFISSPPFNYIVMVLFGWREGGFTLQCLRSLLTWNYAIHRYLPVLVAVWCVWIPGVLVVYCMPTELQFPVGSLIQSFWMMIFKFMRQSGRA